jgi:hypothetical protein
MTLPRAYHEIKKLSREQLTLFVAENIKHLGEDEALAVIENPFVTPMLLMAIAQNPRLAGFYAVRVRLVAHRQTPQAQSAKLIHYLYWFDLVRLSVEVTVPATVRRAIDTLLAIRVDKLTLGERIASARRCSHALVKIFLRDHDPRVFLTVLSNQRVREDDILAVIASRETTPEMLQMIADDQKWSYRYAVRKGLVLNPATPRSAAATQLRFLTPRDRRLIHSNPSTSTYLRRCIERLQPKDFSAHVEQIE